MLSDEKLRYLAVGGWNTLAGCAIFALFYFLLADRMHYLAIAVLSHVVAVGNAWISYRRLVFRSRAPLLPEYLRFNVSSLTVLAANIALLWLLVDAAGLHPITSQVFAVVFTVIAGYLIHKRFSFRDRTFDRQDAGQ